MGWRANTSGKSFMNVGSRAWGCDLRSRTSPVRYLLYVFAPCLFGFLFLIGNLICIRGYVTVDTWWIIESFKIKTAAATAITRPKILVVGGSGAYFGIQA